MATIILNRTSEYLNRLRDYEVYIDEKKVGTVCWKTFNRYQNRLVQQPAINIRYK